MIYAPPDTRNVWNALLGRSQHARSLAADRFLDFKNDGERDEDWRRRSSENIRSGKCLADKLAGWRTFCQQLPDGEAGILIARLKARLIVNAAGGVLENGGLCLDRTSGLPFIPGSAVKGCARKLALVKLQEERTPEAKAGLLEQIAWIFGWGANDWRAGRKPAGNGQVGELHSDFEFACGEGNSWCSIRKVACGRLLNRLGIGTPKTPEEPQVDLPSFAGAVHFLPAYPWQSDPGIEIDIVTPHHTDYYSHPHITTATDTEEPVPSVFPVVSSQNEPLFAFLLARGPRGACGDLALAKAWLRESLALLGIGGKTAAGYGWFDTGEQIQAEAIRWLERELLQCNPSWLEEFRSWDDKKIRKAASAFAFKALEPRVGRESTPEYRFTLAKFIIEQKAGLYTAQKNHAHSDFAKGVVRLANEFNLTLP